MIWDIIGAVVFALGMGTLGWSVIYAKQQQRKRDELLDAYLQRVAPEKQEGGE